VPPLSSLATKQPPARHANVLPPRAPSPALQDRVKIIMQISGANQQSAAAQAAAKGGLIPAFVAIGKSEGIKGGARGPQLVCRYSYKRPGPRRPDNASSSAGTSIAIVTRRHAAGISDMSCVDLLSYTVMLCLCLY